MFRTTSRGNLSCGGSEASALSGGEVLTDWSAFFALRTGIVGFMCAKDVRGGDGNGFCSYQTGLISVGTARVDGLFTI